MMEYSSAESLKAWELNAEFWDQQMGGTSNQFHCEVVRPKVSRLLDIQQGDHILDIGCGNGNYSAYMAEKGAKVVAFDYSYSIHVSLHSQIDMLQHIVIMETLYKVSHKSNAIIIVP